jgi:hypothetical protein
LPNHRTLCQSVGETHVFHWLRGVVVDPQIFSIFGGVRKFLVSIGTVSRLVYNALSFQRGGLANTITSKGLLRVFTPENGNPKLCELENGTLPLESIVFVLIYRSMKTNTKSVRVLSLFGFQTPIESINIVSQQTVSLAGSWLG